MSSPLAEAFLLVTLNNCYETPSKCTQKIGITNGKNLCIKKLMRKFALRKHPENKSKNNIGNEKNIPTL